MMFLTDDELTELTGCHTRAAKEKWLRLNKVTFKKRPDGHLVVLKSHFDERTEGRKYWLSGKSCGRL